MYLQWGSLVDGSFRYQKDEDEGGDDDDDDDGGDDGGNVSTPDIIKDQHGF